MVVIKITAGNDVFSMSTDSDNGLPLRTLQSAFPDAVNLVDHEINFIMSIKDEKIYHPLGWDSNAIYLVLNGSRPHVGTKVRQDLAMFLSRPCEQDLTFCGIYYGKVTTKCGKEQMGQQRTTRYLEGHRCGASLVNDIATKVLNDCSDRVYRVHGETTSTTSIIGRQQHQSVSQVIGSGTQFEDNRVLTTAHPKFILGNQYDLWKSGRTLKATCVYINKPFDFAILESNNLPNTGFPTGLIKIGEKFVTLGYPENSKHDDPSVSEGIIEGIHSDGFHLLGSIGSRHGFSGAPVFDRFSRLVGIVVGGRNGLSDEMTVRSFAKQLVNDAGTQPSMMILPLGLVRAEVFNKSCEDST